MRGDMRGDAYQLGAPMRRLESDMGLPSGCLAIHERRSREQYSAPERPDRPAPAPYYPESEPRQNPRPGTIPVMPDNNHYRPGYQQQYMNPRYQQQQYMDPRYQQQQYMDPRYQQQRYMDPRYQQQQYMDPRYQQQRYMDPRYQQQQYIDSRYQQQRYIDPRYQQQQQYMDPRYSTPLDFRYQNPNYRPTSIDPNQYYEPVNQGRYYDPRIQGNRPYYDQRFNHPYNNPQYQEQYYNSQYNNQYNYPGYPYGSGYQYPYPDTGYQPGDYYKQQWWNQTQYPIDPNQRYIPGNNPILNDYRQQWWQQAQTPPIGYDSQWQQYPTDQNSEQYPYQYEQNNCMQAMQSLVGHSIQEFNPGVPTNLGCAYAVSLCLERAYGLPIRDQGCDQLERDIKQYGFVQIDPRQIQPGDVIIAHRQPGDHGHAAIYAGNGRVYNNNSISGRIQLDNASKFQSREFMQVNVYRKMR